MEPPRFVCVNEGLDVGGSGPDAMSFAPLRKTLDKR